MSDHKVHDAVGGPLTGLQAGAAIAVGANALLVIGVMPALLGSLADAHRLSAAGIGRAATLELLGMGLATGLAGAFLRPVRLRMVGFALSILLAGLDYATILTTGPAILALRGAAGAAEGLLLWITVGMIVRTLTPERWSGVYFTVQAVTQLILAVAFTTLVMHRYGAVGGFSVLAGVTLIGAVPALFLPDRYAPLPKPEGTTGVLPLRGWIALAATVIYVSAGGAVTIYLQPLAHQAGLSADVARTALSVSLVAQVAGAAAATLLAGRVRYFAIFLMTSTAYLVVWWIYGRLPNATLFVVATATAGCFAVLLGPFLTPFIIDADPSRRAAMQNGAAQILGGALGPWLASFVVSDTEVRAVLPLSAGLLVVGLAVVTWLRVTAAKPGVV